MGIFKTKNTVTAQEWVEDAERYAEARGFPLWDFATIDDAVEQYEEGIASVEFVQDIQKDAKYLEEE